MQQNHHGKGLDSMAHSSQAPLDGDQAQFLNPKYVSIYGGETMVGHMASLAHAVLNGTPAHPVSEKKFLHGSEGGLKVLCLGLAKGWHGP